MVAAIGGGERQHLAVLDRVPRPVRQDLFVPRVMVDVGRHGMAVAFIAARHTARGPQPLYHSCDSAGSGCRGRDKHHDQSHQRRHLLISKMRARRSSGGTPRRHSDLAIPTLFGDPSLLREYGRLCLRPARPPGLLFSCLCPGARRLLPRCDEPLDKRRHRRPSSLHRSPTITPVPNAAPESADKIRTMPTPSRQENNDRKSLSIDMSWKFDD